MAISTYAELKTAIANWLARDDLTAYLDDFVTLFEAAANRRLGKARIRQMETSTTLTPSAGSATLPTDYLDWRRVTWAGSPKSELDYVHPSYLQAFNPSDESDTPQIFTIEGSTLKIAKLSTTSLTFDYFQKISALSGTVNWLFTAHPDLYLFGSLCEAEAFNKDAEKATLWKLRRDEAFDEIEKLSRQSRGAGAVRVTGTVV